MLIDICIKFREYSLRGFQVIERTRFVTDRQTDRQTDARGKTMSPDPEGGRHNYMRLSCMLLNKYLKNNYLKFLDFEIFLSTNFAENINVSQPSNRILPYFKKIYVNCRIMGIILLMV